MSSARQWLVWCIHHGIELHIEKSGVLVCTGDESALNIAMAEVSTVDQIRAHREAVRGVLKKDRDAIWEQAIGRALETEREQ